MQVRAERVGSAVVLDLEGRLTVEADMHQLHELVRSIVRLDGRRVVLDLGNVPQLDCSGIGQLVRLNNLVREAGGALTLVNVERRQKHLLQILGLLEAFRVFDDRQEAMAWCWSAAAADRGPAFEQPKASAARPSMGGVFVRALPLDANTR
jgi:anti-anti-sigma factor